MNGRHHNSEHRRPREPRKEAGNDYGGQRRTIAHIDKDEDAVETKKSSAHEKKEEPVERPSRGPWSDNFGGRIRATDIRAKEKSSDSDIGR